MRVHQLVPTASPFDAVTTEALLLADALAAAGFGGDVYAEAAERSIVGRPRSLDAFRPRPDDTVLLHYSIWSRAVIVALAAPCRLVVRYHNITPPEWLAGLNDHVAGLCRKARDSTPLLAARASMAVATSSFSLTELAGFAHCEVVPVVFAAPPPRAAAPQTPPLIVSIGRIVPNKRVDELIRVFCLYQRACAPDAVMALVGSDGGFELYAAACRRLATRLGVRGVQFTGRVTDDEKTTLLGSASAYLCLSEHEGFCVPLVEAMRSAVPILARPFAAVPETIGDAGLVAPTADHAELAELLDRLVTDQALRAGLAGRAERRSRELAPDVATARLVRLLSEDA
jgi:glycosyltransferase involved in cell wall biosynthesis